MPRTNPSTPSTPNALAGQSSPYLLQHAHNPVPWMPWCQEAFEQARRRDVPIFLSIGYATCYWCHVMARESFEDQAVAELLAERFVSIKVDREQRPDVDEAYMAATQIMTGSGGWPMTVFLEPTLGRPFWAGTYFPPTPMHGRPSFLEVLGAIDQAWRTQRDEVMQQAERLAQAVHESLSVQPGERLDVGPQAVAQALRTLLSMADRTHGGFGAAPKFPQPVYLELLLLARDAVDEPTRQAADVALKHTLDRMMVGGLWDHVGGGFHRYAVDATWTVPHFEKMLYDNALLLPVYARAARLLDDPGYARLARRIVRWAVEAMRLPAGGYASALDAQADGREGSTYLWTPQQVRQALAGDADDPQSSALADLAERLFGLDRGPNFKDPHHPDAPAANVLRLDDRLEALAERMGTDAQALQDRVQAIQDRLLEARNARPQPLRDDKCLAAWNGMLLAGLAGAAIDLDEPAMLEHARALSAFLTNHMVAPDGLPWRSWRQGKAEVPGFLEDAAWCIRGWAALARAQRHFDAGDPAEPLARARAMLARTVEAFGQPDAPGVLYDSRRQDLFVRGRSTFDGATPSAHAVLLHALADLHELDPDDPSAMGLAGDVLRAISPAIAQSPLSTAGSTGALLRLMRLDPGLAERAIDAELQRLRSQPPAIDPSFTPVEIYADADRVALGQDLPARLQLVVQIKPGWHVYAADPGQPDLTPLRVAIVGGTGVRAYADYPPGRPLDQDHPVMVYEGQVELPVALELEGPWTGRPMLAVRYQACDQDRCLPARTVELDVAIDRIDPDAPPGVE